MGRISAFSLVEVVVALGIFAVCAIAILGLMSQGLNTDRVSGQEQDASALAQQLALSLERSQRDTNSAAASYIPLSPISDLAWNPASTNAITGVSGNYAYWVQIFPGSTNVAGSRLMNGRIEIAWPSAAVTWDASGTPSKMAGSFSSRTLFFAR